MWCEGSPTLRSPPLCTKGKLERPILIQRDAIRQTGAQHASHMKKAFLLVATALLLEPRADDWPTARAVNVFSENAEYFVRIVPGNSIGDVIGFEGSKRGEYAHGLFYRRMQDQSYTLIKDAVLLNPVAPVDVIVSNSGEVITFDNWHNAGYGKVVVLYSSSGQTIRSWTLENLYSPSKLSLIPMSTSSRWWRCGARGFVDPDRQTKVFVTETLGGTFTFDLNSAAFTYSAGSVRCNPPKDR